jgi:hypothetical protein
LPDEEQTRPLRGADEARRRSDPRSRRYWLQRLDLVLPDEMRQAGALSFAELEDLTRRPLAGRASRETLEEWWEYARRRNWLEEPDPGLWRLTDTALRDVQAMRRRTSSPDPMVGANAVVKWALTAGAVGAAALLSGRYLTVWLAILVVCAVIVACLMIAAIVGKLLDPPIDRLVARWACDWLDGRSVRCQVWRPAAAGAFARLYQASGSVQVEQSRTEAGEDLHAGDVAARRSVASAALDPSPTDQARGAARASDGGEESPY